MDNREIDRLIANEVTKHVSLTTAWNPIDNIYGTLPHYSTSISDAWEVVEKLQENWNVNVGTANLYSKTEGKAREIDKYYCEVYGEKTFLEYANTAPTAICKTALKTIGIEID